HTVDGFDKISLALPFGFIEGTQSPTIDGNKGSDNARGEGRKAEHEHCKHAAVHKQKWDDHQERGRVEQREKEPPSQELSDLLDLLHVFGDHAGGNALKEID